MGVPYSKCEVRRQGPVRRVYGSGIINSIGELALFDRG
jgi:hypothetical protein